MNNEVLHLPYFAHVADKFHKAFVQRELSGLVREKQ